MQASQYVTRCPKQQLNHHAKHQPCTYSMTLISDTYLLAHLCSLFFNIKIFYVFEKATDRGRDRERDLRSAGSLPEWLQWPALG